MKKTAIVSCYFQPNYGSMLQALGTQKALDALGEENETICIDGFRGEIRRAKAVYFAKAALSSDILLSKGGRALTQLRQKLVRNEYSGNVQKRLAAFSAFEKKWFRTSEPYPSLADLSAACEDRYHTVLVGSDQLWLPANIAADYYTLRFVPETVNTVAYATSFGQSSLPRGSERAAMRFLPGIRHLSVREKSGQKLVAKLSGRRVPVVADPTLLFTGEEWTDIQESAPLLPGGYIFCYFLGNNPVHRAFARKLAQSTGCRIAALPHVDEYVRSDEGYADETPWDAGPSEFLNLIRHADWVLTDSYHCTAFSILYGKSFFTFRRFGRRTRQSTNSRLDTLLSQAGLADRLLSGEEEVSDCTGRKIDYTVVRSRMEKLRTFSWQYLQDSLEDRKDTDLHREPRNKGTLIHE